MQGLLPRLALTYGQTGEYKLTGAYDDVTYYKMDGAYYARSKSSLKGERVKKDPKFKRTMQSARRLAKGSHLASQVYRALPRPEQLYTFYKELKSMATLALKEEKNETEVLQLLQQHLMKHRTFPSRFIAHTKSLPVVQRTTPFPRKLFGTPASRQQMTPRRSRKRLSPQPCKRYKNITGRCIHLLTFIHMLSQETQPCSRL